MLRKWSSVRAVEAGARRGWLQGDLLDSLCFARSLALTAHSEPGIPAVTQHQANKDRHSTDIEKYSARISGDDPDPLVSAHPIMWVEICRLGKVEKEEAWKGAGFPTGLASPTSDSPDAAF